MRGRFDHEDESRRWFAERNAAEASRLLAEAEEKRGHAAALYRKNAELYLQVGDRAAVKEALRAARAVERDR